MFRLQHRLNAKIDWHPDSILRLRMQVHLLLTQVTEFEEQQKVEQRKIELVGETFLKFSQSVISVRFMLYE